ncbi:hypothetical protein [Evansella tamaricis]|uniref:Uncharacterized protein n=1 Tax=Evansella tamaricis TaxID=2069301 RepID=A0ABS6JBU2_9BACI|nr:hypothetical protein [Evansella tamaricis]MBU9711115.1 hypothetical protein [Evansella tamaricis]
MRDLMMITSLTENQMLDKLLILKGIYRNGFIELNKATRNYDAGLELADLFEQLVAKNRSLLTDRDLDDCQLLIVQLKLTCLDHSDRWNAFINYYDDLSQFDNYSFGMRSLLNVQKRRYAVIKRKIDRASKGKKLGNLVHQKQSELSNEQILNRAKQVIDWIEHIANEK